MAVMILLRSLAEWHRHNQNEKSTDCGETCLSKEDICVSIEGGILDGSGIASANMLRISAARRDRARARALDPLIRYSVVKRSTSIGIEEGARITSTIFHSANTPPATLFKGGNASADSFRAMRVVWLISPHLGENWLNLSGGTFRNLLSLLISRG